MRICHFHEILNIIKLNKNVAEQNGRNEQYNGFCTCIMKLLVVVHCNEKLPNSPDAVSGKKNVADSKISRYVLTGPNTNSSWRLSSEEPRPFALLARF